MNKKTSSSESGPALYTLREAATRCGYRRVNTMREKHLASDSQRQALGHRILNGTAFVDAALIEKLAADLEAERAARGNWRVRNLGAFAVPGRRKPNGAKNCGKV